jgi:hypothetical protein
MTGGELNVGDKGARASRSNLHDNDFVATPFRERRIVSIEDILGQRPVSSNQQAGNRSWPVRHAVRAPRSDVGPGAGSWKTPSPTGQATGNVRIRDGRAGSPSRKAQRVGAGRKSPATNPSSKEAFAAKNRVIRVTYRGANRGGTVNRRSPMMPSKPNQPSTGNRLGGRWAGMQRPNTP